MDCQFHFFFVGYNCVLNCGNWKSIGEQDGEMNELYPPINKNIMVHGGFLLGSHLTSFIFIAIKVFIGILGESFEFQFLAMLLIDFNKGFNQIWNRSFLFNYIYPPTPADARGSAPGNNTFDSCFGLLQQQQPCCLIAAAQQQHHSSSSSHQQQHQQQAAAGSSRQQQAAGSRRQQQAAAGSSRHQ